MLFTLLVVFLALSLRVSCASIQARQNQPPSPPLPATDPATDGLQTFNPVELGQLCENPAYYCIYVDQVRADIVHASPVNATDHPDMFKMLIACEEDGQPLPYAVIGARAGGAKKKQEPDEKVEKKDTDAGENGVGVSLLQKNPSQDQGQKDKDASLASDNGANGQPSISAPAAADPGQPKKMAHDYFDDVTVPLADA
ncbi:hypothetical protein NDA16_004746 [Ustilago loliicola]|nr:hypothetical protein NDA16_004746 [Ustilago loliicola]